MYSTRKAITYNRHTETKNKSIPIRTIPDPFPQIISGKRVIIVGPSITVQKCNLGSFIDSFDIVIRLNKSVPVPSSMHAHIGSRTDILYNSLNTTDYPGENKLDPQMFRRCGIKYVRCPYPPISPFRKDIRAFQNRNRNQIPFGHIDLEYYRKLRYNLGTRPYTGTCAIADILQHSVKELYILGIDFYSYGYAKFYRSIPDSKLQQLRNNHIHQREPQIDLVRRFYLLDDRVVVDNVLDKILLEQYDNLFYSIRSQVDLSRTCISAVQTYIDQDHPLAKCARRNKKGKICIIGTLDGNEINTDHLKQFDFTIDLFPERLPPLPIMGNIAILQKASDLKPESYAPHQGVLILESYHKSYRVNKLNPRFQNFSPSSVLYLNPLFTKYLQIALSQSIIPNGGLSADILLALFFATYFSEKNDIYVINMLTYQDWTQYNGKSRASAVNQRLLYRYLTKRKWIREY